VRVARTVDELPQHPRAVAIGTFDGVHLGHRRVVEAAVASGLAATAVTFDPHPREVLGDAVPLIITLNRRLELLAELGVEEALVVGFDRELASSAPEEFVDAVLRPLSVAAVAAGEGFRFGHRRTGDLALLERRPLRAAAPPRALAPAARRARVRQRGRTRGTDCAGRGRDAGGRPADLT
jgi:riboflavin kinase/FMN adenylyltransferase